MAITPYKGKNDPYLWVPDNCPQINGNWYFNVKYEDAIGGWKGVADDGTKIFYSHDGKKKILNKPKKQLSLAL